MKLGELLLPRPPPAERLPPGYRNTVTSFRFDLSDRRSYLLVLDHGRLSAREGGGKAECILSCSPENFRRILNGELNLLIAVLRGSVRFRGNSDAAKILYFYLRLANAREDSPRAPTP